VFELSVFLVMESSSYRGEDFELKVVFDLWRRNVGRIRITDRQVSLSYRGEMLAKFELHRRNLSSSSYREEMFSEFELQSLLYWFFAVRIIRTYSAAVRVMESGLCTFSIGMTWY